MLSWDKESMKTQVKSQKATLVNLTAAAVCVVIHWERCFILAVLYKTTSASHDKHRKEEIRKPQTILSKLNIYLRRGHAGDPGCIMCWVPSHWLRVLLRLHIMKCGNFNPKKAFISKHWKSSDANRSLRGKNEKHQANQVILQMDTQLFLWGCQVQKDTSILPAVGSFF